MATTHAQLAPLGGTFPLLARTFKGHPLTYLDSAATSQKPQVVLDAEVDFYRRLNANVHRGVYTLSEEATDAYESARATAARFVGATDPAEIIFVRGTTEALNLAASCLGRSHLRKGDRVVSTEMEHHSNIVPWHQLRTTAGTDLQFVGLTDDGKLALEDYDKLLGPRTKVTTLTHVSNVLGTLNPVRKIADQAHDAGSLVVLDAAQSAPHMPLDVKALGVDLLAFSGHKVFGPTGIGVLWGRREVLEKMPPYMGGGEMISEVGKTEITYKEIPAKFEAGTPNVAGAVVLAVALDYVKGLGWEKVAHHEQALVRDAMTRLSSTFGDHVRIFGPSFKDGHHAVVAFALKGAHPHDIADLLNEDGVAIRAGHHCAQLVMKRYQVSALARASYSVYNSPGDTDRLLTALGKVDRLFGEKSAVRAARD